MRIYFAGIPAGDEPIERRERDVMAMVQHRLISYHFVLNGAHPIDVIEEGINASDGDVRRYRRRG